jgi:protoporphyrinogen oxidase
MNSLHFGIVGGGMLGMTLALRLSQSGYRVTIFEAAPHVGGLASPWQLGDVVWDRHYHVTLFSDLALRDLLRELGIEHELQWSTTRTGFYVSGKLYSLSNTLDFLRFPPLTLRQKIRLAATILHASRIRNYRPLEQIRAIDWLTDLSGRDTVEAIWYPLLRAKLGSNAEKASAAFIWAIIARMYAARRSHAKVERFGYVPGGYARVLQRFEQHLRSLGVEILTGCRVERVAARGENMYVSCADGRTYTFDRVAVTLAAPIAAQVCTGLSDRETKLLRGIEYQGILCASLLTDRPLGGYYVTNITDRWVPFTGVIEMSALVDPAAFGGKTLVYLPKYVPAADPALETPDEAIEAEFLDALERMYPHFTRKQVSAFRISRVRYVLPISTLGYSERVPPVRTSVPGLYLVNSSHIVNGTLNVNETVQLANQAVDTLTQTLPAPIAEAV